MAYLGGRDLAKRLGKDLKVSPAPTTPPAWDFDLHMGREAFVSSWDKIRQLSEGESFTIAAGEFALLLTEERLEIPSDLVGFISVKFKWKLQGLANVSGFHVDPLYRGKLVFAVYNSGPKDVMLRQGTDVFMMGLSELAAPASTAPKVSYDSIPATLATNLKGPPVSVFQMDGRIRKLEDALLRRQTIFKTIIKFGLAVLAGAIAGIAGTLITQSLAGS